MSSPFPPFAWKTLRRPLRDEERAEVAVAVRGLLRFQHTLARWSPLKTAPDATPFVSLYAEGSLRGCYGSQEGGPAERLARAFLRAGEDTRFGGVSAAHRGGLVAQVSYARDARLVNPSVAEDEIELGTHGVALVRDKAPSVLLLPHVARDERLDARELLRALARKSGLDSGDFGDGALYLFETEDVVVRDESARRARPSGAAEDHAAAWLASLVAPDGRVTFAVDPRARRRVEAGEMHHGRAAALVQALAAAGGYSKVVEKARSRLGDDIRSGLRGAALEGWPKNTAAVAGTLALAVLAGASVTRELTSFVAGSNAREIARTPWHAAQVATALGADTPAELWQACIADLDAHPWAPWTLLAADTRRDRSVRDRTARALAAAIRRTAPHRGGASVTPVPEIALTALSVEALQRHPASWARKAAAIGRDFLASMQLLGERLYGALDSDLARGAFPASPVADLLRADVTAHALLALLAGRKA